VRLLHLSQALHQLRRRRSLRLRLVRACQPWRGPRLWQRRVLLLRHDQPARPCRDLQAASLFLARLPCRGRWVPRLRRQVWRGRQARLSPPRLGRLAPRCPLQRRDRPWAQQVRQLHSRDRLARRFQQVSGQLSRRARSHDQQAHSRRARCLPP
jgi:hypothetical protein